jgi:hypothetical protein
VNAGTLKPLYASFKCDKYTFTNVNGATVTQEAAITAGSFVLGIAAAITANVGGATSVNVGDGTDDDEFGVLSAVVDGTNFTWSVLTPFVAAADTNIVLTAIGGDADFDENGNVDVYVTYIKPDAL